MSRHLLDLARSAARGSIGRVPRSRWKALALFLVARAAEKGTIRQGLNTAATLFGMALAPELADRIVMLGSGAAFVISFLTREDTPAEVVVPPADAAQ